MIEIKSLSQVASLHKNDQFKYKGVIYTAESEPYEKDGKLGIDITTDNTLWITALKYDLRNKLTTLGRNIAIQAELIGPKVQNNIYKLTDHQLAVFDIFDIDQKSYLTPTERTVLVDQLGLINAPLIDSNFSLDGFTIDQLLEMADGKTTINKSEHLREGLVFKANTVERISFKTVSNRYLLKTDS